MKLTKSVWVPSPETCAISSNSIAGVWQKFSLPMPSALETIPVTLHKITTHCACLLLQQLDAPYISLLHEAIHICHCATHQSACQLCATMQQIPPHIHKVRATDCLQVPLCPMSKGTWSLNTSLHYVTFRDKLLLQMIPPLPSCLSSTLYIAHNLGSTLKCIRSLSHCI